MICDTSALLAAFSADQRFHEECTEALMIAETRLVSALVLNEVDYLSRRWWGQQAAERISHALAGSAYEILPYSQQTLGTAAEVMKTYADLGLGLVDASLVAHAKETHTREIFTLDQRHFRAIRALDGRHFRLLPFDQG